MLSKNKIKFIQALSAKKTRVKEGLFVAEGDKLVRDLLPYFKCHTLLATTMWWDHNSTQTAAECLNCTEEELAKASFLKQPQEVLALFEQPRVEIDFEAPNRSLCLALDGVQDPGNVGTIIRLADWFGIEHVFCSFTCADVYNPKTVQATMGGLARVQVHYCSLVELIHKQIDTPVYGTFLDGDNIYQEPLSETGLIVLGSEGQGVSAEVSALINRKLFIPNYPMGRETSESLNVAMATAIVCAEFRRRLT